MSVNSTNPKKHREPTGYDRGLPYYPSIAACSGATGIPVAALKAAKRGGCVGFKASRVYLADVLPYLFRDENGGEGTNWGEALKEAQAKRERIKLAKDEKSVVSRDFIEEGLASGMSLIFGELDRAFCSELPAVFKGLEEVQIRARSAEAIAQLKAAFADKLGKLMAGEETNE